jgi:hypothetical protein
MKPNIFAFTFLGILAAALVIAGCGDNAYDSGSDEGSREACEYAVSKALDEGRYDDALSYSCAHSMDKAAAYVGKAGYDVKDVIESMIEANRSASGNSIDVYMNSLVDTVTNDSLGYLYKAMDAYELIGASDPIYDDARFNGIVLVNSLIAVSNIKGIIGGTTIPETSSCDRNNNGTPDMADAAGCALYISAGVGNCTAMGATFSGPVNNIQFTGFSAIYNGYVITIDSGGGPTSAPDCNATEKKLISGGFVVATTSNTCTDLTGGDTWPCPFEDNSVPVDVVTTFEEILESSGDLLDTIVNSEYLEVTEAVDELLLDACGVDGTCTSQEIADYLQSLN